MQFSRVFEKKACQTVCLDIVSSIEIKSNSTFPWLSTYLFVSHQPKDTFFLKLVDTTVAIPSPLLPFCQSFFLLLFIHPFSLFLCGLLFYCLFSFFRFVFFIALRLPLSFSPLFCLCFSAHVVSSLAYRPTPTLLGLKGLVVVAVVCKRTLA
jgi:hypothetical protein